MKRLRLFALTVAIFFGMRVVYILADDARTDTEPGATSNKQSKHVDAAIKAATVTSPNDFPLGQVQLWKNAQGTPIIPVVAVAERDGAGSYDLGRGDSSDGKRVYLSQPVPTASGGNVVFLPTGTPTSTAVAGAVFVSGLGWSTPTTTQTPFAGTRHTAVIAATSSEAWIDTWVCGGNSYSYTVSGTFAANGVAYAVYGFNGPTTPSAGATNGVLLTGPVTLSASSYVAVDPKFRFAAMRLQDFSGATTVTVNDFCNNFNNRQ